MFQIQTQYQKLLQLSFTVFVYSLCYFLIILKFLCRLLCLQIISDKPSGKVFHSLEKFLLTRKETKLGCYYHYYYEKVKAQSAPPFTKHVKM